MTQTIDTTEIPADLVADEATNEPDIVVAAPTADGWLYAMWGIRPGTSSPTTSARVTYRYPAEIADWLNRMWGIPLADAGTTPRTT